MSRLLVETNVLLWWLTDDAALSPTAREVLADPAKEPLVSAATLWEIAIDNAPSASSPHPTTCRIGIVDEGFSWLAISPMHAWQVRDLPGHHRDPFYCLLVAQARTERLPIVTADARFSDYGVEVRW